MALSSGHNSPEYQAFIKAVKDGRTANIEDYLAAYPEFLDLTDRHGKKPLHRATTKGRGSVVKLLLQHGSTSLASLDNEGWTPLHYSALHGHNSIVELLLRCGSTSLDSHTNKGWTPLHLAVSGGHHSMVELLLQHGSNFFDSPTYVGRAPLFYATRGRYYSAMKILKAVGATLSLKGLNYEQIEKLQAPIPESEVLEIRFRIYFRRSLLSQLR